MKKILGLDLGTNSIGWALVEIDHENGIVNIMGIGSRILPMNAGEIKDFESSGKIKSTAAQRTEKRGARKLNERFLLRRDRLHLVLNLLNALPDHYNLEIDFSNKRNEKCGKFKPNKEPKLAYLPKQKGEKAEFLFMESYQKMLNENGIKNKKGNRIPYDWTLYYLRQKALTKEISLEELAWVLLSYNQKRGYEKTEVEDMATKDNEIIDELNLRVIEVEPKIDENGNFYFDVHLEGNDNFIYKEYTKEQMTFKDDVKEVVKTSKVDEKGNIDEEKVEFKVIDIYELKIRDVKYEKENGKHKYILTYQNGWSDEKPPINNYTSKYKNAINKSFDYIVETDYNVQGEVKKQLGKERKIREPDLREGSNDWNLVKKKTEKNALVFNSQNGFRDDNNNPKKYISTIIYENLKNDVKSEDQIHTKIIGGIFQVVDRDFYREELNDIIATQRQFHKGLKDEQIFEKCVKTLYPKNKNHQEALLKNKNAIQHLLVEDILLYQRPLKSKKSEIANCKYEFRFKEVDENTKNPIEVINEETGEILLKEVIPLKVVSSTHPLFQEFRIWEKLHNLKLIQLEKVINGKLQTNQDVTMDYINSDKAYQMLFKKLNNQKYLSQKQFLKICKDEFGVPYDKKNENFVWKFSDDEEIKGNETRVSFATRFKRCGFLEYDNFLTQKKELELWHYLFSVSYKDRNANNHKSTKSFFNKFLVGSGVSETVKEKVIKDFVKYPKFPSKYCTYSEKALKKLIPLIRLGHNNVVDYWAAEEWYLKWKKFLDIRKQEILKRLRGIDFSSEKVDYSNAIDINPRIPFPKGLFHTFNKFGKLEEFSRLNLTKASYLVYGRHSELVKPKFWNSPDQIRKELHKELKQHSLNNPIAEKIILEMMQVVAEIWEHYGEKNENSKDYKRLFDKINIEVGRDLKKSAKDKETLSKRMSANRVQNKRIRQVLEEYLAQNPYDANPVNPDHFDRLKIVEEGAEHTKNTDKDFFKDKQYSKNEIENILKKPQITIADFEKYKLWIEQGYKSPYTNQIIKLTDLFNGNKYNIDHIFPQASVTNDSLNNKIVCEREVNKLKRGKTGRGFINNPGLRKVHCEAHKSPRNPKGEVDIVKDEVYVALVRTQFSGNKKRILLSKEVPKEFTSSQLNNARHIAKKAMELLSHIVREPGEIEFCSKNVLPVTGSVTSKLKKTWKLNEVWTELVAPRFIRLNELTNSNLFGDWQFSRSGHKYFDCKVGDLIRNKDESFDIKRIDHRHHALDALVVALCTKKHVIYINNINADAKLEDFGKQKRLEHYRALLKREIMFSRPRKDEPIEKDWFYLLPGEIRKKDTENSNKETILTKSYHSEGFGSFGSDYKRLILNALNHTIVTFKQNLRVINKNVNYYQAGFNNRNKKRQKPFTIKENSKNKYNWGIRRRLSEDTFYGKRLINGENKIVVRNDLNTSFTKSKIETVTDKIIQRILFNQIKRYDTVALPFEEAIVHYEGLLEKEEFEAIVRNKENNFSCVDAFIKHLKENKAKFKKSDFSNLNVFVDRILGKDFRIDISYNLKEHPEIAFSPEKIDEMNRPENIRKLNINENGEEKNHAPIRKVQISRGFGKQRKVSENELSVKSKQYVVTASGSNLYLGFYERKFKDEMGNMVRERMFKDIDLISLIETLKQDKSKRINPLPEKIYDKDQNKYNWIFTLSPLDLVYVPTEEEIENPNFMDFGNLSEEQINRIYKFVDGGFNDKGILQTNFIPYSFSKTLNIKDLKISDKKYNGEVTLTTDKPKQQKTLENFHPSLYVKIMIRDVCWKLKMDRLGNISKV